MQNDHVVQMSENNCRKDIGVLTDIFDFWGEGLPSAKIYSGFSFSAQTCVLWVMFQWERDKRNDRANGPPAFCDLKNRARLAPIQPSIY